MSGDEECGREDMKWRREKGDWATGLGEAGRIWERKGVKGVAIGSSSEKRGMEGRRSGYRERGRSERGVWV